MKKNINSLDTKVLVTAAKTYRKAKELEETAWKSWNKAATKCAYALNVVAPKYGDSIPAGVAFNCLHNANSTKICMCTYCPKLEG